MIETTKHFLMIFNSPKKFYLVFSSFLLVSYIKIKTILVRNKFII